MTTTVQHTSSPSLQSSRILVVQVRPLAALGLGAAIVRTGAKVNLCRSSDAALAVLASPDNTFDGAVLDGELPRPVLQRIAASLREACKPCLSVGVGTPADDTAVRRLVEAGVMELVIPPVKETAVIEALGRCVVETSRLRSAVVQAPTGSGAGRRPPHWTAASARAVPRFNPDIEHAVDCYAKRVRLSPREISVLKLIALGYLYDEIGEVLSIANRTVKMHAANVRRKVGAPNRMALVRKVLCA